MVCGLGKNTNYSYKMRITNYGLSIKHGLGIKHGLRTMYIKTALEE